MKYFISIILLLSLSTILCGQTNECDPVWMIYGTYKDGDNINIEALESAMELNVLAENCEWTFEILSFEVSINNEVIGQCEGAEICKNILKKFKKSEEGDAIIFNDIEVKMNDDKTIKLNALRLFVK